MDWLAMQMFGEGNWLMNILWFIMLMAFFWFYPRLMISQIMYKLESTAKELEDMSARSKKFIIGRVAGKRKPEKKLAESVERFFEFFVISPTSLDPYGIVGKLDHLVREERKRFRYFVSQIAPKMDSENQASLEMGLAAGISMHQIAKIVRHYVELVRKTKNLQIAMVLQMQLPMIERIARAVYKGTQTLAKGEVVGDGLGPLVMVALAGKSKMKEVYEETLTARTKIQGRNAILLKARGPGGRLGRLDRAVEKILSKQKVAKIVTIDAAAKLEGEKTGSVAEGVGVAIGGIGIEKTHIEDIAVRRNIPLDSIIVKMSQEEAITKMRKPIFDAVPMVKESVGRSLETVKPGSTVLIVGVGNTSGVGNSSAAVDSVKKQVDAHEKKLREKKARKKSWFS
jgi:hypothetical protein